MVIWKRTRCYNCDGHGIVASYSCNDFEGADECNICAGSGSIAISPKDRLAKWPGGPFLGSFPGSYQKESTIWR